MKTRINEVLAVVGSLVWRGFGLFLFILGTSAGVGAVVAGNWWTGCLVAWFTLMIGIIGAIGYAIATTGQASTNTVASAVNDAVQKVQDDRDKA
jgi:hypothetical protein